MFCEFRGCIWNEMDNCIADNPINEVEGDRVIYCESLDVPDGVCEYCGQEFEDDYDIVEYQGVNVRRNYKTCGC